MTLAKDKQHFDLKRVFALCFAVYAVLIIAFYFLAGDQLHCRRSRGEVTMPAAEAGTIELVQDTYVQQTFTAKIQRLESVSVQWGTYYRANTGAVTMALYRGEELLGQQTFDAAGITEGGVTTLTFDTPLEGLADVPLTLRLWADSATGSAVSPMMNTSAPQTEGFTLDLNGTAAAGTLCFSAGGEDSALLGVRGGVRAAVGSVPVLVVQAVAAGEAQRAGEGRCCRAEVPVSHQAAGGSGLQGEVQTLGAGRVLELPEPAAEHGSAVCGVFQSVQI